MVIEHDPGSWSAEESDRLLTDIDASALGARVRLHGELDIATVAEFSAVVRQLHREGHREVLVDLSDLTFCDARGIAGLLQAHRLLEDSGSHLTVAEVSPQLRRVLAISGLDGVLDLR